MIKKAVLGALAALSLAGCNSIAIGNEEAHIYENRDASVQIEENPKKEQDNERFFAQCHDGLYDFDTRCIDFSQGYLNNAISSVYKIERIARYEKDGKQEEEKSHCTSVLIENGMVLTAKHCMYFRNLDIKGIKYDTEFSLVSDNKHYGLEKLIEGNADFAILAMKKPADLPFFPYQLGDTTDMEAGNFTYIIGFVGREYPMLRDGIVTKVEPNDNGWGEGYFLVSNGIHFGDSGGATIAFRDGIPELIGINCYKHTAHDHAGGVLRIDRIRNEVLARFLLSFEIMLLP
ncbi:MAG: serine protease [Nanoarchaeota archaeon]|nr:serine protease [Nanoarchaeota archaeon]